MLYMDELETLSPVVFFFKATTKQIPCESTYVRYSQVVVVRATGNEERTKGLIGMEFQ